MSDPDDRGRSLLREPTDEDHMRAAMAEARLASEQGEVPIGAIAVCEGRVVGRAHNQRETLADPTAHAEMLALTMAAGELERWRLTGVTLYVTLEPCTMCAGALVLARVDRVVFGASDPKAGACGSLYRIHADERLNHAFEVVPGVLGDECGELLSEWFRQRRRRSPPG
jgi:tRNA(adenine34) deaminase